MAAPSLRTETARNGRNAEGVKPGNTTVGKEASAPAARRWSASCAKLGSVKWERLANALSSAVRKAAMEVRRNGDLA